MKILIIGAGNGGLAFGAKLIAKGVQVNLYDKFKDVLKPIIDNNNQIQFEKDDGMHTMKFNLVTNDLEKALINVEFIYVVTPAFAHQSIAEELAKYVSSEQIVVLHPGRTGGALEVKKVLEENGKAETVVAEAETLLFACRKLNDVTIKIYGTKKSVGVAALPSSKTDYVTEKMNETLPFFRSCSNVVETSLSNIGAIFHPAPFLLNIARVECQERFTYYHQGITPSIANMLEQLDQERLKIAQGFQLKIPSALEWLNESYGLTGTTLYDAIQMNKSYREIYAPLNSASRYVLEDVPMSLVPLSELAKLVQVDTPIMESLIVLASNMYGQDFKRFGRTLDRLGLNKQFHLIH